jgi:hypothetical protein
MQSTGHASTHAVSFTPMHGSAITYAKARLLQAKCSNLRQACCRTRVTSLFWYGLTSTSYPPEVEHFSPEMGVVPGCAHDEYRRIWLPAKVFPQILPVTIWQTIVAYHDVRTASVQPFGGLAHRCGPILPTCMRGEHPRQAPPVLGCRGNDKHSPGGVLNVRMTRADLMLVSHHSGCIRSSHVFSFTRRRRKLNRTPVTPEKTCVTETMRVAGKGSTCSRSARATRFGARGV